MVLGAFYQLVFMKARWNHWDCAGRNSGKCWRKRWKIKCERLLPHRKYLLL